MAPSSPGKLPGPPADLGARALPIRLIEGAIFRIHLTRRECMYFGKTASERFDDPLCQFGVLYAALEPEAAFAEVFLRRLSLMLISERDLECRSIAEIAAKRLRCVDLTGNGLRRLSCDNRISTEKPYQTTGRWARALFSHPDQPDGILYRSRHNPRFRCAALFDRCQPRLGFRRSEPLLAGTRRGWTIRQITKYDLAVQPPP